MSSTESNNSPKLTPQIPSGEDVKPKPQQQPRKQKSKGSSNKNRDLLSVYNEKFPDGTIGYVDTHCHLDFILQRLNQQDVNQKAKQNPQPQPIQEGTIIDPANPATQEGQEAVPVKSLAQEAQENIPTWTMKRLIAEGHIGNWDGCVTICCEPESFDAILQIINTDTSGKIFAGFGIHPHEASKWDDAIEKKFVDIMSHPKVIAWGECGLDYFYDNSPRDIQKTVFVRQMQLCVESGMPLIVHTRDAEEDTVELMTKHLPKDWPIHIHCCTSSRNMVLPLLKHFPNLYVGFTGCITFPSADAIRDTLSVVPIERLLLETDGPFMAPVPFRGKVAHSGMVPFIALKMAEVKEVSVEELMKQVRINTRNVYGF